MPNLAIEDDGLPILRCYGRPHDGNLIYVVCPGCGNEHTYRVKRELSKEDIGEFIGFRESSCVPDRRNNRRPIEGYYLIYCGVEETN